ncbi:MAG: PspA/IM30 family protein [bacterium]
MGIIDRIKTIIKANINDLLSKAEDPELILNQLIEDMRGTYKEARAQTTVAFADENMLKAKYEKEKKEVSHWQERAELALRSGREDLAREALARKLEHERLMVEYEVQYTKQHTATEALINGLKALEQKIEEAKRKKDLLIAKAKRAEAARTINTTLADMGDESAFEAFERMEERVEKIEATAVAEGKMAELEASTQKLEEEFAKLGHSDVDTELKALKAKLGLAELPPAGESNK